MSIKFYMVFRWFLGALVMLLCLQHVSASEIIYASNSVGGNYIGEHVVVFQDTSNQLTFKEVRASPALFRSNDETVPNLGANGFINWVKFTIINDTDHMPLILNITNPTIDHVTLYTLRNGTVDSLSINENDDYNKRAYHHQFFAFNLYVAKGDSIICYLKLKSTEQLLIPLAISDSKRFVREIGGFDTRSGIYIGIMLAMLLYNLFLYFSARDPHYLAYVHYVFWVFMTQVALLGYFYRFFQGGGVSNGHLLTFLGAMSGIASVIFVKSFLGTKKYSAKVNIGLNLIIVGDLFAIALLAFGFPSLSYEMVNFVAGLGSVIVLIIGYIVYRQGNRSAKLFLVAWGVFLGSVIVFVLKDYGLLNYNLFTVHAVQIGSSLEALLLSFALGDKINLYRKEKEESQLRTIEIAKENEKLIREQNIVLEQRVEERTYALKESNESLRQTLSDLKETQTQLVEAEKMASLGQLTAGVAHEINNPINFVTSNVAPLKRDIAMVWETVDEIEKIAMSDLPVTEKESRIVAYKEALDIDYLKTEIDFLLKGMHEGASRTAEIVKSLRVFSRVDEDSLKFADINEGLDSTLVILNSVIKEGVVVDKQYAQLPLIECYPGKLNQVFLNIITNALYAINKKFNGKQGGVLGIKTEMDATNVYISIRDNGTGMPASVREKIFEPFFTTKEVGEGTGLGMSIVYNAIKKHQGEIKIDSEMGMGTTFTLIIPLKQPVQ